MRHLQYLLKIQWSCLKTNMIFLKFIHFHFWLHWKWFCCVYRQWKALLWWKLYCGYRSVHSDPNVFGKADPVNSYIKTYNQDLKFIEIDEWEFAFRSDLLQMLSKDNNNDFPLWGTLLVCIGIVALICSVFIFIFMRKSNQKSRSISAWI